MRYLDEKKLKVIKIVVEGEVSIAYGAAKLRRSEKQSGDASKNYLLILM